MGITTYPKTNIYNGLAIGLNSTDCVVIQAVKVRTTVELLVIIVIIIIIIIIIIELRLHGCRIKLVHCSST
jgi:hypothetical protein